ncbi:MAG TPA: thiamine-phosphate kinase [Myxococcales bacterium LLY-WYZ-16_1]|nr:thiamine-phosphate kinase [Myxococcales bacterium LLY-WYZ-16_1]
MQSLTEEGVIRRMLRAAPARDAVVPNGDDAAVVRIEGDVVLTTDDLVEDVHFKRAWSAPEQVGRKLVAVNASDLAAMTAEPRHLLVTLILPADLDPEWLNRLADGIAEGCGRDGLTVIGGNVSGSPGPVVLSATAVGQVPRGGAAGRFGARAGDDLWITVGPDGGLGAARAGYQVLAAEARSGPTALSAADRARLVQAQLDPVPRVRMGRSLRGRVTGLCDVSDGLARDLGRMLGDAGCELDGASLPIAGAVRAWALAAGRDPLDLAIQGGEEYELLFSGDPGRRPEFEALQVDGVRAVRIGSVTAGGARVVRGAGPQRTLSGGWVHFGGAAAGDET